MRELTMSVLAAALAAGSAAAAEPGGAPTDRLARGRYLVEQAGQCQDCHTPRGPKGEFVKTQWLLGAELGFLPAAPMPWTKVAPPIAGLPTLTHEQAVQFLMTGERPGKPQVTPPMPEYRFDKADAEAIASYLKSLAR